MIAKDLIRWTIVATMAAALASCSAFVNPTTGDRYDDAPDSGAVSADSAAPTPDTEALKSEVERLKRDNVALRANQSEAQARLEAMEDELAQERAEHARFREMMETNFDLLEQSVSRSLSESMAQDEAAGQKSAAQPSGPLPRRELPPPTQAPEGTEPMTHWDDEDSGPPPAAVVQQPTGNAGAQNESATGKSTAMQEPPATETAAVSGTGQGAPARQRPSALETLKSRQPQWSESAPVPAAVAPMNTPPAASDEPAEDPDLTPPAEPVEMSAHPAAKPLYEKGFVHFARGDYDASIRTYEDFLARFPADSHSDNAQFWIGESHFQQERYDGAEAAYRQVLRNYEHRSTLEGFKTPDAIYRLGQIYAARDDTHRAAYYFGNVVQRFPESTAGRKAQRELDALQLDTAADPRLGADGSDS